MEIGWEIGMLFVMEFIKVLRYEVHKKSLLEEFVKGICHKVHKRVLEYPKSLFQNVC